MAQPVQDGELIFNIPGVEKECKTWYRVYGDLSKRTKRPLVAVHGGPGLSHDSLFTLRDLSSRYDIPVVFYDQVGGGRSTKLPEKRGDASFWTEELFMDELDNLLKHLGIQDDFDALGHSWGGMLLIRYAGVRQPEGLKHLILGDTLARMADWIVSANQLVKKLPQETQDIIMKHEADGTTDSPVYHEAFMEFCKHFVMRAQPWPEEFIYSLSGLQVDSTVYNTMCGPSEFNITGTLKTWDATDILPNIKVPTILFNGRYDEAQDFVVAPLFKHIPRVRWYTFADSAHMPHLEEPEKYMELVADFCSY